MREFPNELFEVQKMIELARRILEREDDNKYYNYFIAFADAEKQKKYEEFGNVDAIHEKILNAI